MSYYNITFLVFTALFVLFRTETRGQTICCGPYQFQAYILQKIAQYDQQKDKASIESVYLRYYYDYNNKIVALEQNVTDEKNGHVRREHLIVDFSKGRMWTIKGKNCTVASAGGSISPPCIPEGANFLGSHKFSNIPVNFWTFTDSTGRNSFRSSVTQDKCISVSETALFDGPVFYLVTNFFQNVTDITDRSVFEVPSFCPKTTEMLKNSNSPSFQIPWILKRYSLKLK